MEYIEVIKIFLLETLEPVGLVHAVLFMVVNGIVYGCSKDYYDNERYIFTCDKQNESKRNLCLSNFNELHPLSASMLIPSLILYCPTVIWMFHGICVTAMKKSMKGNPRIPYFYYGQIILRLVIFLGLSASFTYHHKTLDVSTIFECKVQLQTFDCSVSKADGKTYINITNFVIVWLSLIVTIAELIDYKWKQNKLAHQYANVAMNNTSEAQVARVRPMGLETASCNSNQGTAPAYLQAPGTAGQRPAIDGAANEASNKETAPGTAGQRPAIDGAANEASNQGQTISQLNLKTYNHIADELDKNKGPAVKNWIGLAQKYGYQPKEISKIRDGGEAHRSFFHNLADERPKLTLKEIYKHLDTMDHPNRSIHFNIEKLGKRAENESSKLGDLFEDSRKLNFVLENIADALIFKDFSRGSWKDLAASLGFHRRIIENFESQGAVRSYSPARNLLAKLGEQNKTVSSLLTKLGEIERLSLQSYLQEEIKKGTCWDH